MAAAKRVRQPRSDSASSAADDSERTKLRKFQMELGDRIKSIRNDLGLSVHEVADKAGMNYQSIYNYERGTINPSAYALLKVARALGKTVDELLPDVK